MNMSYDIERSRFVKLCGERELLITADNIASRSWFSWRHCLRRVRAIERDKRMYAMKLLRAAQKERTRPLYKEQATMLNLCKQKAEMLRFFIAPLTALIYKDTAQPVVLNSKRVGITLFAERMRGNKARVYYSSKLNKALAFKRAVCVPCAGYIKTYQTHFIVEAL